MARQASAEKIFSLHPIPLTPLPTSLCLPACLITHKTSSHHLSSRVCVLVVLVCLSRATAKKVFSLPIFTSHRPSLPPSLPSFLHSHTINPSTHHNHTLTYCCRFKTNTTLSIPLFYFACLLPSSFSSSHPSLPPSLPSLRTLSSLTRRRRC